MFQKKEALKVKEVLLKMPRIKLDEEKRKLYKNVDWSKNELILEVKIWHSGWCAHTIYFRDDKKQIWFDSVRGRKLIEVTTNFSDITEFNDAYFDMVTYFKPLYDKYFQYLDASEISNMLALPDVLKQIINDYLFVIEEE